MPRYRFTTLPTGARKGEWRDTRREAIEDAIEARMAERDEHTGQVYMDPLVDIEEE